MSSVPSVKLNTGASIPAIGLGAWAGLEAAERAAAKSWFLTALQAGYKHFDTAWMYGTEKALGKAIKESGVPRSELFITSKLPWHHHARVEVSIEQSLKNAGLDYFDLYLLHWPQAVAFEADETLLPRNEDGSVKLDESVTFKDSWAALEKLYASGKVKAIGVSNFSIKTLDELLKIAKVVPAANQIELHPYLTQNELFAYCKEKGIVVEAYTPTGYATVRDDPLIVELGKKYNVSPAQVILGWHVARGNVAVPKSENVDRQKQNLNLPKLSAEDVERITGLDRNKRLCNDADEKGSVYGWTFEQLGW